MVAFESVAISYVRFDTRSRNPTKCENSFNTEAVNFKSEHAKGTNP
jgi:hypothetical protein